MIHSIYLTTAGYVRVMGGAEQWLTGYDGPLKRHLGDLLRLAAQQVADNPGAAVEWYWIRVGHWCQRVDEADVRSFYDLTLKPAAAPSAPLAPPASEEVKREQEKPAPAAERPRGRPGRPRKDRGA